MKVVACTVSAVAAALLAGFSAAQDRSASNDFGSDGSGGGPEGVGGTRTATKSTSSSGSNEVDAWSNPTGSLPASADSSSSSSSVGTSNAFGSDGSGGSSEGVGETMRPPTWPTWSTSSSGSNGVDGWSNPTGSPAAFAGSSSSSFDSSGSSAGWSVPSAGSATTPPYSNAYNNEENLYHYPEMDGAVEQMKRKKYYFNPSDGFSLSTSDTTTGVAVGDCKMHAYCVHVVFESDYGAMSTFDAFYLDSYESMGGPIGTSSFNVGDRAPLVLGRFPKESVDRLGANWSQVFNWNDTRRTTWTFFPTYTSPDFNEIDLTLSLKQVYTALPNFYSQYGDEMNMGPLYSSNLTDQVVIRINAHHANLYTSASGMLPIVVNHTGSQLVDINITATRLYADARNDSNEIQLTVKLGRRKYGGLAPWIPVRASSCFFPPSWFSACLNAYAFSLRRAADDLLSYKTSSSVFDIRPIVKMCADYAPYPSGSGSWDTGDSQQANSHGSMDAGSMNGDGGTQTNPPPPPMAPASWDGATTNSRDPMLDLEEALRNTVHRFPRCALNDVTMKADGQGVTLHHEPATTRIDFRVSNFSFYFVLAIDNQTVTTPVFMSDMSSQQITQGIYSVLPAGREWLQLSVRYGNNLEEIEDVRRQNRWTMEAHEDASQWSGGWTQLTGSSPGGDNSAGWDGGSQLAGSYDNSDAGESVESVAGMFRPKDPTLLPVPAEQYSVFIQFESIVVVPRILAVLSPQPNMTSSHDVGKLQLVLSPILQLDVNYVPPSADVDFEYRIEPQWKTEARKLLRKLPMDESCRKCLKVFERCLLNEDCVYGVNSYFAEAIQWERWVNQTSNSTTEFDISGVLRQARLFFPGKGFEKLQDLLLCWAKSECDLDEAATSAHDETTDTRESTRSPTELQFTPTMVNLSIHRDHQFSVYHNGEKKYWPTPDCERSGYEVFLPRDVLRSEPAYVRSFAILTNCNGGFIPQFYEYNITWPDGFVEPIQFDVYDGLWTRSSQSSLIARPWALRIKRSIPHRDSLDEDRRVPWPRLLAWIRLFETIPFGTGLRPSNNTNTNATNSTTETAVLPLPMASSPTAVCPTCADLLMGCLSDGGCVTAARAWLAWVLPGPLIKETSDWDGFTRLSWLGDPFSKDSVADEFREPLLNFMACLTKYQCAVGYSTPSNQTNMTVPTTVRLRAVRKVVIPRGSSFQIAFGSLPSVLIRSSDDVVDDAQPFVDQIRAATDEDIGSYWWNECANDWCLPSVNFTGSLDAVRQIRLVGNTSQITVQSDTYNVRFQSPSPSKPSWNYLLNWFGANFSRPSNGIYCAACQPKFGACYEDGDCWRDVRDYVLPVLERKRGWLNQWSDFISDGHAQYKADIGSLVSSYALNSMRTSSWWLFTDILQCLSVSNCDVATMDSAVEPPATAYVPTYVKLERASIYAMLYQNTTLNFNGRRYSHAGSVSELEVFLRSGFGNRSDVPLSVVEDVSNIYAGTGSSSYNVTFSDNFFESMPSINVVGSGNVPVSNTYWSNSPYVWVNSWRMTLECTDQQPQWNRLTNMLSVPPAPNATTPTLDTPFECESAHIAKRECFNDYWCKYEMIRSLLPAIKLGLLASKPAYNPDTGLFDVDLTIQAQTQYARLVAMIEQAVICVAANTTMTTRPTFQRGFVQFVRPAVGPLIVRRKESYANDSQNDQDWTETQFREYANSSWYLNTSTSLRSWTKTDKEIEYDLELTGSIGVTPVTLAWVNDTTGERMESTSTPSRLGFQSQSFNMYEAALPWLKWLSS